MSKNDDGGLHARNLWAIYVQAVAPQEGRREKEGRRQADVGKRAGVSQSTVSRWRDGKVGAPKDGATVAAFARAYHHNVLEAFVAAGMLEEADAGRGLPEESRDFLALLRQIPDGVEPREWLIARGGFTEVPQEELDLPSSIERRRGESPERA